MMETTALQTLLSQARTLFEDLTFQHANRWKAESADRRIIGYLPLYIPREIVHSAGMLPVGLFGAGDRMQVVRGDAYFQSYICHLPRTVIEMGLDGNMDHFDGFLFPAICDVIRNLSGIFRLKFPDSYVRYLDFPQNFEPAVGGVFYRHELQCLMDDLEGLNGKKPSTEELNRSIALYNVNRRLIADLSAFRSSWPAKISAADYYLAMRAGYGMPVEEHNTFITDLLSGLEKVETEAEDKIRVVVSGSFCEQPPLGLIKSIESSGCYIVEDDFQLGSRMITGEIPADTGDPLGALVTAYLESVTASSVVYDPRGTKAKALTDQVRSRNADGVIFCAPSFCDPALLDRPQLEQAMDREGIRHFNIQYHENLGQFHAIKEQAGTFSDTIKLWA